MAKHLTGEHKKGFFNSTLGNFMRAGFVGALVAGAAVALTGGLALLPIAAAAVGGGVFAGGLMATGGGVRWGFETLRNGIKGIFGFGRDAGQEVYNAADQGQRVGFAEGLITLLGAAMGIQSLREKAANIFGGRGGRDEGGVDAASPSASQPSAQPSAAQQGVPHFERVLSEFRDKETGVYSVTAEDLARPEVRQAFEDRAKWVKQFRDRGDIQYRSDMNQASLRDVDVSDPNRIVLDDAQLLNGRNRDVINTLGENIEAQLKGLDRQMGRQERDLNKLLRDESKAIERGDLDRAESIHAKIDEVQAKLNGILGERQEVIAPSAPAREAAPEVAPAAAPTADVGVIEWKDGAGEKLAGLVDEIPGLRVFGAEDKIPDGPTSKLSDRPTPVKGGETERLPSGLYIPKGSMDGVTMGARQASGTNVTPGSSAGSAPKPTGRSGPGA